jgi:CheY-like chemotaxis protein
MAEGGPRVQERIDKALAGVDRAAAITRKLLGFAHWRTDGARLTAVNDFIRNVAELFGKSPTASIEVVLRLADDLAPVNVDPGDLQDAALNLTLNARDAMPAGGRLIIETANVTLDAETAAAAQPPGEAGDFVMIAVSDSGTGMADAVKEKIFEPFFSTKTTGRGTGLGLSMVYGFVRRSGGLIRVDSTPGRGTVFSLYLPRARDEAGPPAAAEAEAKPGLPGGAETILVVDDEEALIEVACLYLRSFGYRTLTANGGAQALAVLRSGTAVDLLFSDVVMPGSLDGYRLAEEARRLRPGLRVLLASGYSLSRQEDSEYLARLAADLLKKPYSQADLAHAVRRALDAAAAE